MRKILIIDEACKVLGEEISDKFMDKETQQPIWNLTAIAREVISSYARSNS